MLKLTAYEESYVNEQGDKVPARALYSSTDKYQALLASEGVTSGGDFRGKANSIAAESIQSAQEEATASKIKTSRESFEEERGSVKGSGNVNTVVGGTSVNNNTVNKMTSSRPRTSDGDKTITSLNGMW
jgi:hypothetical protein